VRDLGRLGTFGRHHLAWAEFVRGLGNRAAHAREWALDSAEADVLLIACEQLLHFVYVRPALEARWHAERSQAAARAVPLEPRAFERAVREHYLTLGAEAEAPVSSRRADLALFMDADQSQVMLVEMKSTDWDHLETARVRPTLQRHTDQMLAYIDSPTSMGADGARAIERTGARYVTLAYPTRPATPGLAEEIERVLDNSGIAVVWFDRETAR
jgi:hypothetical protein